MHRSLTEVLKSKSNTSSEEVKEELKNYNKNAKSIGELGYKYNDVGKLVYSKDDAPFRFLDQAHYELLGDLIVGEIQRKMKEEYGLKEVFLPFDDDLTTVNSYASNKEQKEEEKPKRSTRSTKNQKTENNNNNKSEVDEVPDAKNEPKVNIFMSEDALTNKNRLLVIICGSGAVRAGQWARSLCINDSLNTGTILPYLQKAKEEGFGVIVANPNFNFIVKPKEGNEEDNGNKEKKPQVDKIYIRGNENPFRHIAYVWRIINSSVAKDIAVVAHSFGGVLASQLLHDMEEDIFGDEKVPKRIRCIAFTDSVHNFSSHWPKRVKEFLKNHSINWAKSTNPLDTPEKPFGGCQVRSAGTTIHEYTSSACMKPLWEFILEELSASNN